MQEGASDLEEPEKPLFTVIFKATSYLQTTVSLALKKLFHTMSEPQGNVLHVEYKEKAAVYNCYMSFCKDAGMFVPCTHSSSLGDSFFLIVQIPENTTPFFLSGKVAWLNHGRRKGVGVRMFPDDNSRRFKIAIENLLASSLKSNNPTYTM